MCCSLWTCSSGGATKALLREGEAISSFLTRLVAEFSRAGLPAVRSTLASGVRGLMRLLESPSGCRSVEVSV